MGNGKRQEQADSNLETLLAIAKDAIPLSKRNLNSDYPWDLIATLAAHLAYRSLKPTQANIAIVAQLAEIDLHTYDMHSIVRTIPPIITKITSG